MFQVGTRSTQINIKSRSQGDQWKQEVVDIGRVQGEFQIEFQARRSYSVAGDIAIDDVFFDNCDLPEPSTRACRSFEFKCGKTST